MRTNGLRYVLLASVLIAAGSCRAPVAPVPENKTERILRGCDEAARLLGQMKAAERSFDYDADGTARLPEELWQSLPPPMQDGLVKAIAYHAVCERGELEERQVTIRSVETGGILAEQTVTEFDR